LCQKEKKKSYTIKIKTKLLKSYFTINTLDSAASQPVSAFLLEQTGIMLNFKLRVFFVEGKKSWKS